MLLRPVLVVRNMFVKITARVLQMHKEKLQLQKQYWCQQTGKMRKFIVL